MLTDAPSPPSESATAQAASETVPAEVRARVRWARCGVLAYIAGAVWRFYWIFYAHPPTEYIYSDMAWYVDHAKRLLEPGYAGTIYDTLYPPATGYLLAATYALDPSWKLMLTLQCLMALVVPVVIAYLARTLFDTRVAWLSLILSSLWFPFIDYTGYFMAETPFMLLMLLSVAALLRALLTPSLRRAVGWAVLSGLAFAASAEFKGQALMPALLMSLFLICVYWKRQRKRILLIQAAALLAASTVMLPVAVHVTRLNENRPVLLSTNGALMFLTGHHGHYGNLFFNDDKRNWYFNSFNPTHVERGNDGRSVYAFGVYDSDLIMQVAWKWIYRHKGESIQLSFDHVFDTFYGSLPWPTCSTSDRRWVMTFQHIFLVVILIPIFIFFSQKWRAMLTLKPAAFGDLFVFVPVLGLIVTVFLTMGEPRYRIPFDGFLIILAARFYTGQAKRTAVPTPPAPPFQGGENGGGAASRTVPMLEYV